MEITFFGFVPINAFEGSGGAPRKCPMRCGASTTELVYTIKKKWCFFTVVDVVVVFNAVYGSSKVPHASRSER